MEQEDIPNLKAIKILARQVIEDHDVNEWDERTLGTDFGDSLEALRKALGIEPPERS